MSDHKQQIGIRRKTPSSKRSPRSRGAEGVSSSSDRETDSFDADAASLTLDSSFFVPLEGFTSSVVLEPPDALLDVVMLGCTHRKDDLFRTNLLYIAKARLIAVDWTGVNPTVWGNYLPLITITRFLIFRLREFISKFGTKPIVFVADNILSEWLAKQIALSYHLGQLSGGLEILGVIVDPAWSSSLAVSSAALATSAMTGDAPRLSVSLPPGSATPLGGLMQSSITGSKNNSNGNNNNSNTGNSMNNIGGIGANKSASPLLSSTHEPDVSITDIVLAQYRIFIDDEIMSPPTSPRTGSPGPGAAAAGGNDTPPHLAGPRITVPPSMLAGLNSMVDSDFHSRASGGDIGGVPSPTVGSGNTANGAYTTDDMYTSGVSDWSDAEGSMRGESAFSPMGNAKQLTAPHVSSTLARKVFLRRLFRVGTASAVPKEALLMTFCYAVALDRVLLQTPTATIRPLSQAEDFVLQLVNQVRQQQQQQQQQQHQTSGVGTSSSDTATGRFKSDKYQFRFQDNIFYLKKVEMVAVQQQQQQHDGDTASGMEGFLSPRRSALQAELTTLHQSSFRFLPTALKSAIRSIVTWNALGSRKALVSRLKANTLQISLSGSPRQVQIAQLCMYYLLGFNPARDSPAPGIVLQPDPTLPCFYDPSALSSSFAPIQDASAAIDKLQRHLDRMAPKVLSRAASSSTLGGGGGAEYSSGGGGETKSQKRRSDRRTVFRPPEPASPIRIAFFGTPSAGKSTLINCLLGESLVYTSIKESTGAPTEICSQRPSHEALIRELSASSSSRSLVSPHSPQLSISLGGGGVSSSSSPDTSPTSSKRSSAVRSPGSQPRVSRSAAQLTNVGSIDITTTGGERGVRGVSPPVLKRLSAPRNRSPSQRILSTTSSSGRDQEKDASPPPVNTRSVTFAQDDHHSDTNANAATKQTEARRDASSTSSSARRSAMKKQLSAPALPRRGSHGMGGDGDLDLPSPSSSASSTNNPALRQLNLARVGGGVRADKAGQPTSSSMTKAPSAGSISPRFGGSSTPSNDNGKLPLAEVVFISEEEFEEVMHPLERESVSLQAAMDRLTQNQCDTLGISEQERLARIAKVTQQLESFTQRKQSLTTLFNKHYMPTRRRYELDSRERLMEFIRIGEHKQEASLADIVNRVRVYMPDNPLLRYLTIVDTPGWNLDSHAWGEDFRMRRSQVLASTVDAWIYLTPAYELSDPLSEHLSLLRSLVRDNAPGMVVLSCFDNNKSGHEHGLHASLNQRLDSVNLYFEAARTGHSRDVAPLTCAKLVADYSDILRVKLELRSATGPRVHQLKTQVKRKWRAFLDYVNSVLSFIVKDPTNSSSRDPHCSSSSSDDDSTDDDADDNGVDGLLDLDEGNIPSKAPKRIEQFVKLTNIAVGSSQDELVGDLAAELSGLPHMYHQLRQLLQPTVKKSLSQRYVKLDQHARRVLTVQLQSTIRLHHSIRVSIDQGRHAAQLMEQRSAVQSSITAMEKLHQTFKRQCEKMRLRLEQQLGMALDLIISTSDLPLLLEHRRKREKRKPLDLFLSHREAISLREVLDAAVRTSCHQLLARCFSSIALIHLKLFGQHDLESPLDYGRIQDEDYWLEEAQCITGGWEQPVELRGSKKDTKQVSDWLKRAQASMHDRKSHCTRIVVRRFDTWTKRLFSEQNDCVAAYITKNKKEVVRIEKELKRSRAAQLDSSQVKAISAKIQKKRSRSDNLFNIYLADIFNNCNKYYV